MQSCQLPPSRGSWCFSCTQCIQRGKRPYVLLSPPSPQHSCKHVITPVHVITPGAYFTVKDQVHTEQDPTSMPCLPDLALPLLTMSQWLRASEVTKLACTTDTVNARAASGSKSRVKGCPVIHPTTTTKGLQQQENRAAQAGQVKLTIVLLTLVPVAALPATHCC